MHSRCITVIIVYRKQEREKKEVREKSEQKSGDLAGGDLEVRVRPRHCRGEREREREREREKRKRETRRICQRVPDREGGRGYAVVYVSVCA